MAPPTIIDAVARRTRTARRPPSPRCFPTHDAPTHRIDDCRQPPHDQVFRIAEPRGPFVQLLLDDLGRRLAFLFGQRGFLAGRLQLRQAGGFQLRLLGGFPGQGFLPGLFRRAGFRPGWRVGGGGLAVAGAVAVVELDQLGLYAQAAQPGIGFRSFLAIQVAAQHHHVA